MTLPPVLIHMVLTCTIVACFDVYGSRREGWPLARKWYGAYVRSFAGVLYDCRMYYNTLTCARHIWPLAKERKRRGKNPSGGWFLYAYSSHVTILSYLRRYECQCAGNSEKLQEKALKSNFRIESVGKRKGLVGI